MEVLKSKYSLIVIISAILVACGNDKIVNIKSEEINWTVNIPPGFELISEEQWDEVKNKGKIELENYLDRNLNDEDAETTLMVYKNGAFHTIEANYKKHNSEEDFKKRISALNKVTYESLAFAIPNTTLDSISSIQKIDGEDFYAFEIKVNYENGEQLTTKSFRKLIGNKMFSVNILFRDPSIGDKLIQSILDSKLQE
ncbi:MAG: hypothetical protein DWQ02_11050 [Bacteroidetes bacterium]|nr:MAG: hypothetical protein DWQ02_11050 [Bacteroidota bacterium]